jgi:hypothetical protein
MRFWGAGRWRPAGAGDVSSPAHDVSASAFAHSAAAPAQAPASDLYGVMSESLVRLGLQIVHEVRGPMRLWDFSRRLGSRLNMPAMPLSQLSDAVRATLSTIDDQRLRILAPGSRGGGGTGAGYVYDAADPDSWPVRSSR